MPFRASSVARRTPKNSMTRRYPLLRWPPGDIRGRLPTPKHRNRRADEILQQIAVIASELHDLIVGVSSSISIMCSCTSAHASARFGIGREVRIVGEDRSGLTYSSSWTRKQLRQT